MKYANIIFDWNRTLYSPITADLLPGARQLLTKLKTQNIPLFLISHGNHQTLTAIKKFNLENFFVKIIIVTTEKQANDFAPYINLQNPRLTLVIGDRLDGEVGIGYELGATTIWLPEKTLDTGVSDLEKTKANYIAADLAQVEKIIFAT